MNMNFILLLVYFRLTTLPTKGNDADVGVVCWKQTKDNTTSRKSFIHKLS